MAPIKPLAPPAVPPVAPGPRPAPAGNEPGIAFKPGLDAPRNTAAVPGPRAAVAPAPAARPSTIQKPLTLQALSAYAGMVIGTQDAADDGPAVARVATAEPASRQAGDAPPPPPGTLIDLKV